MEVLLSNVSAEKLARLLVGFGVVKQESITPRMTLDAVDALLRGTNLCSTTKDELGLLRTYQIRPGSPDNPRDVDNLLTVSFNELTGFAVCSARGRVNIDRVQKVLEGSG